MDGWMEGCSWKRRVKGRVKGGGSEGGGRSEGGGAFFFCMSGRLVGWWV